MRTHTREQFRPFFFSAALVLFGVLLLAPVGRGQEVPDSVSKAVYDARFPLDPEGSRRLHDRTFMRVNFLDFEGLMTPADQRFQYEAIEGVVWNDRNKNGFTDQGERGLSGEVVYLDVNHNGHRDKGESYTHTDDNGHYELEVRVGNRYRRFTVAWDHNQPMQALEQTWPRYRWQERDGHFYTLTTIFGDWEDCQYEAHAMGGNLVTIDSPEENRWLSFAFRGNYSRGHYDRIPDRDQRLDPRNNSKLWIGLRRKDNQWEWASGAKLAFQADLWSPWYESVDSAYLVTHSGDKPMTWWNGPAAALHEDCHPRGIIEAGKPDRWPPQTVLVPQGIVLRNVNFGLDGRQHVHDHSSGGIRPPGHGTEENQPSPGHGMDEKSPDPDKDPGVEKPAVTGDKVVFMNFPLADLAGDSRNVITARDVSGNGHHGRIIGDVESAPDHRDRAGLAMSFGQQPDFPIYKRNEPTGILVRSNRTLFTSTNLTISAWIYPESENGCILQGGGGRPYRSAILIALQDRRLRVTINGHTFTLSQLPLHLNSWNHLTVNYQAPGDVGFAVIRVNGDWASVKIPGGSPLAATNTFTVGMHIDPEVRGFKGRIDNLLIQGVSSTSVHGRP
jgi:hypothetical protein